MGVFSKTHWTACTAWLSMTSNIAVIAALFALDARDLYYKLAWVGPHASYSFHTGSTSILDHTPLQVTPSRDIRLQNSSNRGIPMDSGWPSFLSRCQQLHALGASGSRFFLSAMGTNCSLGGQDLIPTPRLIMTSDQRVDALVWASCSLLQVYRRPPICYERIVTDFYQRYNCQEHDGIIPAAFNSPAEMELLRFLEMASDSVPMHQVVCVEAIEVAHVSTAKSSPYTPTMFGCGSPSSFRSEFVGIHNPQIVNLLDHMAWLTVDVITVLGTRYVIRQNCFSRYTVHLDGEGALVLQSHTATNFSSFGQLYALLIVIDVVLLVLNCRSSLELVQWMSFPRYSEVQAWAAQQEAAVIGLQSKPSSQKLVPKLPLFWQAKRSLAAFKTHVSSIVPGASSRPDPRLVRLQRRRRLLATMEAMSGATAIEEEQLYSFFSRSLYRNPHIAVLTLTTQLISWLLVLPNAVVWTWSDSSTQQVHAYMSSIRCWVVLLILCNTVWSGVVRISERAAYAITKRVFLTSIDVLAIASLVSFLLRHEIFAMSEIKWQLGRQRVSDVTSFVGGYLAHGNTFHGALDSVSLTSLKVFGILYGPLASILVSSLGVVVILLAIKAVYFSRRRRVMMRRAQRRVTQQLSRMSKRMSTRENSTTTTMDGSGNNILGMSPAESTTPGDENGDDMDDVAEQEKALLHALREPYRRLPLEDWLDQPIRATSLIRNALRMETVRDTTRFIRPSCYLDFGIIVKRGVIHSRIGFSDPWKSKMTVQEYMTHVENQRPLADVLPAQEIGPRLSQARNVGSFQRGGGSNGRVLSRGDLKRKQSLHVPLS